MYLQMLPLGSYWQHPKVSVTTFQPSEGRFYPLCTEVLEGLVSSIPVIWREWNTPKLWLFNWIFQLSPETSQWAQMNLILFPAKSSTKSIFDHCLCSQVTLSSVGTLPTRKAVKLKDSKMLLWQNECDWQIQWLVIQLSFMEHYSPRHGVICICLFFNLKLLTVWWRK